MLSPYVFHTRIAYSDIDQDLNLSLLGAMRLMQEAAVIHSDLSGYSVMDVDRTRVVWMLIQWRVRILGKVRWNEPVDVVTWPQTMEKLTSARCFQIKDQKGGLIAIGESDWVLVNADTGRIMRIPPEVANAYDLISDGVFAEPFGKPSQHIGQETCSSRVLRRDIDTNHHVNNLVYLDYAREALPEELAGRSFPEVVIRYHRQFLLGDQVRCYYENTDQGHLVQLCGNDPRQVHCTVLFRE